LFFGHVESVSPPAHFVTTENGMDVFPGIVSVSPTGELMARAAAEYAARLLKAAMERRPRVRLVAATGASQLDFLGNLTRGAGIDWTRVQLFHLDEYLGIGIDHPASFARYIRDRIIEPTGIAMYHLLDGAGDPALVLRAANDALGEGPIDVAFVGIGENGHLAFNDPPANFEAEDPYLIVDLDEACRRQQVGEGWFPTFEDVPRRAISMSIRQIMKAEAIVCVVPDERKAEAVAASLTGPVTPHVPASILQQHPNVRIFLDLASARLLPASAREAARS
jgi:glucosamine-6-phosphate deaminase